MAIVKDRGYAGPSTGLRYRANNGPFSDGIRALSVQAHAPGAKDRADSNFT
jgi:hypothetical protein